jgi:hypothetical protein
MAASCKERFTTMHTLTLELPDDIYEPLLHQAQRNASTPEALLTQWAIKAVQPVPEDPLLKLLGSIEGDVSDISAKHDDYLGRSLLTDSAR